MEFKVTPMPFIIRLTYFRNYQSLIRAYIVIFAFSALGT